MTGTSRSSQPLKAPEFSSALRSRRRLILVGGIVLIVATAAAYVASLRGPFVYDDQPSIAENITIQDLGHIGDVLNPPDKAITIGGRPVLNLSFALNYAIGRLDVRVYHATNILIHIFTGLALFGLVRRTLLQPTLNERYGKSALPMSFTIALVWLLHPLATESVTYLAQRAESLMAFFYLLTLYFFIHSVQSLSPRPWRALSVVACFLGMATKENMVSAPLLVFLFDRTFVAGSFRAAREKRRAYYGAMACTWLLLIALVISTGGNRGGTVGFGLGVTWWQYFLTQFPALLRYLQLSFWPAPLIFEYGTIWVKGITEILPQIALAVFLVSSTALALWKKPAIGFLGVLFFSVLAPTSLLPGTTQMIVEHRMYLPLAAVTSLSVAAIFYLGGRSTLFLFLIVALFFGYLTFRRNLDYRSELALWGDTVKKSPVNAIARANFGSALAQVGRLTEAIAEDEMAVKLQPRCVPALSNLGDALTQTGQPAKAITLLEEALRIDPNYPEAHLNLGVALDMLNRTTEAIPHYERALQLRPGNPSAHNDHGDALRRLGYAQEATAEYEEALRLKPDYPEAHLNLGTMLFKAGRTPAAERHFVEAQRIKPADATVQLSWGNALIESGHVQESLPHYERAVQIQPNKAEARYNYGNALAALGRLDEALVHFAEALRISPEYAEADDNLANTLVMLQRNAEAVPYYEAALRLKPDSAAVHNNLGLALARLGRLQEATPHFARAVQLSPNYKEAQENLAHAEAELH